MPDRLCPGAKGQPPCGAPLLPHKKLCPACRLKARRAVNRRAQAAFRERKRIEKRKPVELIESRIAFMTPEGPLMLAPGGCGKPGHV